MEQFGSGSMETEIKPASLVLFRRGKGGKLWCARESLFSAHSASLGKAKGGGGGGGKKWKKKRENDGRVGSGVKLVCLREGREERERN